MLGIHKDRENQVEISYSVRAKCLSEYCLSAIYHVYSASHDNDLVSACLFSVMLLTFCLENSMHLVMETHVYCHMALFEVLRPRRTFESLVTYMQVFGSAAALLSILENSWRMSNSLRTTSQLINAIITERLVYRLVTVFVLCHSRSTRRQSSRSRHIAEEVA